MEPVTHFLTGACIGRAGLNRKTAYATVTAVLAAEAADLDVLWGLAGPVEGLKHHRGITHTFIGAPLVAAAVVCAVLGTVWLRSRWRATRAAPAKRRQPVDWRWLELTALIAAMSHLLLDWTNNYGLRPFFPFNPRWYAGSFVFIVEPALLALLALALLAPALGGLIGGEIGGRKKPFRGQGWAIAALSGMVLVWGWRWSEHQRAENLLATTPVTAAVVTRTIVEPYPLNPFRWHAIMETPELYQTAEIDTRTGSVESDSRLDAIYKPSATPATEAAKQTLLGRVYLDWGSWAVVRDVGQLPMAAVSPPDLGPGRSWTTVTFTDLRFQYSFMGRGANAGTAPLSGWVYMVDGRDEAGMGMGNREQK